MKALARNWKAVLAVLMALTAVLVFLLLYLPGREDYESEKDALDAEITSLQATIQSTGNYAGIQDSLEAAENAIADSRQALYAHFPQELREEDQILYTLYLEEQFGTEIVFDFGTVIPVTSFSDGASLDALALTVNYETTYQGFKDMVNYLATDSRITSIQTCTLNYDAEQDLAAGTMTLLCYTVNAQGRTYEEPDIQTPDTGKDNIFD